jgi:hypothetical protein
MAILRERAVWARPKPPKRVVLALTQAEQDNVRRVIRALCRIHGSSETAAKLADCVAYALLKREVKPTPLVQKYGIARMFDEALAGSCYKPAHRNDPLGIVRA